MRSVTRKLPCPLFLNQLPSTAFLLPSLLLTAAEVAYTFQSLPSHQLLQQPVSILSLQPRRSL